MLIPKIPYVRDKKHVAFSHQLVCVICGALDVHFHHLRRGRTRRGQYRAGDNEGLPLCPHHHNVGPESLHGRESAGEGEMEYLARHGISDPLGLAENLHENSGDYETCMHLIEQSRLAPTTQEGE